MKFCRKTHTRWQAERKPRRHPSPMEPVTEFVQISLKADAIEPVKRPLYERFGIRYDDVRPMQVFGLFLHLISQFCN
jgi:hypothetical protein